MTRSEASSVLAAVAEAGETGHFPEGVTLVDVGAALRRLCINSQEADAESTNVLPLIVWGYIQSLK